MLLDELKHIWKVCFDDDDDYIGLYFSQRYRAENTLVHSEAGRAVAMMTLLPVAIVTPEKVYEGRYVYAVATLPAFRGRGIASALTRRAGLHMKENGTDLAVVVPAASGLFDFYTRQGYTPGLYRRVVTFSAHEIDAASFLQGTPLADAYWFYALREQRFGQCGFFVRWDVAALAYILKECRTSGGEAFYFTAGNDEGYVVVEPQGDTILVKEVACSPLLAPRILAFLKRRYPSFGRFVCYLPVFSSLWEHRGEEVPTAMLRWLIPNPPEVPAGKAYVGLLKD